MQIGVALLKGTPQNKLLVRMTWAQVVGNLSQRLQRNNKRNLELCSMVATKLFIMKRTVHIIPFVVLWLQMAKKLTSESCTVTMKPVTSPTESYEPLCASCHGVAFLIRIFSQQQLHENLTQENTHKHPPLCLFWVPFPRLEVCIQKVDEINAQINWVGWWTGLTSQKLNLEGQSYGHQKFCFDIRSQHQAFMIW